MTAMAVLRHPCLHGISTSLYVDGWNWRRAGTSIRQESITAKIIISVLAELGVGGDPRGGTAVRRPLGVVDPDTKQW